MKKLSILLIGLVTTATAFSFGPSGTVIISDIPANAREASAQMEGISTLQSLINQISTAQNVQQQIMNLKNLSNFQQNPGAAVQQVNSAVTNLLNTFNQSNNSNIQNLSQLINSLASSSTAEGMNLKLMASANMQLSAIQNTLQQIQAQQQAVIAYKQAQVAQEQAGQQQNDKNNQAFINDIKGF